MMIMLLNAIETSRRLQIEYWRLVHINLFHTNLSRTSLSHINFER
jgi:hypothetical protein